MILLIEGGRLITKSTETKKHVIAIVSSFDDNSMQLKILRVPVGVVQWLILHDDEASIRHG